MIRSLMMLGFLTLANPAQAWLTTNNQHITPMEGGQFMVNAAPGLGAPLSWCAAGDYAIRGLNLSPTTPIWRISEPPRARGEGVVFSLSPEGSAQKSGLFRIPDTSRLIAAEAQSLCSGWRD